MLSISFIMILLMILTFYYEYKKEETTESIHKNILTFIKEPNIRKILGLNSIFILLLTNLPLYYMWIYFRKNDFFPYEFLEKIGLIKVLGVENIFISLILITYIFLPLTHRFVDGITKITLIIGFCLVYILIFILFIKGLNYNFCIVMSYMLFILSIGIQIFTRIITQECQMKNWWLGLISIFILLALPFFFKQGLIKRTLFNNSMGNFEITLIEDNKEKDYCLLLRTENLYYLKDYRNKDIYIINTERVNLKYQINKTYCEISKND